MKIKHNAEIIIGEYQFAESFNKEVLHQLQFAENIGHTNVKASLHTEWDWLPDNQKIKNFKSDKFKEWNNKRVGAALGTIIAIIISHHIKNMRIVVLNDQLDCISIVD